jgi:nucleotide-binding universal stress UspA family protein
MRVLLAIDGSVSSDRARDLVAGIGWPEGTLIRVVAALDHIEQLLGVPWLMPLEPDRGEVEASLVVQYRSALEAASRELEAPGRGVETILLRGRPATAIVDDARTFGADLLILGSRGHGQLETMLLGSVSAEVVDHAPCPVLIARGTHLRSILLADDGSAGAAEAAELLARWPIFTGHRVTILGASEVAIPWSAGTAPGLYDQVLASYTESVQEARREVAAIVSATADRLSNAGLTTGIEVRDGDPAAVIVKTAAELGADLVVCGTRGLTGLSRLLLGSVARNVLVHAPCSVLVVRPTSAAEGAASTANPAGTASG